MKSIEDLESILSIEGISREDGKKARLKAFQQWKDKWVLEVSCEQSMIKNNLSIEEQEFLIYHMATKMSEEIIEKVDR